jgi:hypothetical protein
VSASSPEDGSRFVFRNVAPSNVLWNTAMVKVKKKESLNPSVMEHGQAPGSIPGATRYSEK